MKITPTEPYKAVYLSKQGNIPCRVTGVVDDSNKLRIKIRRISEDGPPFLHFVHDVTKYVAANKIRRAQT